MWCDTCGTRYDTCRITHISSHSWCLLRGCRLLDLENVTEVSLSPRIYCMFKSLFVQFWMSPYTKSFTLDLGSPHDNSVLVLASFKCCLHVDGTQTYSTTGETYNIQPHTVLLLRDIPSPKVPQSQKCVMFPGFRLFLTYI